MNKLGKSEKAVVGTVSQSSRRKILVRASAGAIIASIPARTAWAGILNSIVASGHGSDMNAGVCTQVLSPGYWKNHAGLEKKNGSFQVNSWGGLDPHASFSSIFGGNPLVGKNDTTLIEVLESPGNNPNKFGGPSNVNFFMVASYLNAINHGGSLGIVFPVIGPGQPFADESQYAHYLYNEASINPDGVGSMLSAIVDVYHVDSDYDPDSSTASGSDVASLNNLSICN